MVTALSSPKISYGAPPVLQVNLEFLLQVNLPTIDATNCDQHQHDRSNNPSVYLWIEEKANVFPFVIAQRKLADLPVNHRFRTHKLVSMNLRLERYSQNYQQTITLVTTKHAVRPFKEKPRPSPHSSYNAAGHAAQQPNVCLPGAVKSGAGCPMTTSGCG
jgi:hypothetical protein